jgi:hypothetical protein
MDRKSSSVAIRHLAIVLVAAFTLPVHTPGADITAMPGQVASQQAPAAPVVLAQGRCFNGRCF